MRLKKFGSNTFHSDNLGPFKDEGVRKMLKGPTVIKRLEASNLMKSRCIFSVTLILVLLLTLVFAVQAQASFAAAGSYTIKWYAADPALDGATYPKLLPGEITVPAIGRASEPIINANGSDTVTSLAPKSMVLGQIVPYEVEITVTGSTSPENGVITIVPEWLTKTTSGTDFGYDPSFLVYTAFVDYGDPNHIDPGANATVDSVNSQILDLGGSNERISSIITISGLDSGDRVYVEIWVVLKSIIPAGTTGNVQTSLSGAYTTNLPGVDINTGNQTIPLLRVQEFYSSDADLSIIKSDSPDPVTQGGTLTYSIEVKNNSTDTYANGVVVTDTLDANTTYVSSSLTPTTQSGSSITWNIGALDPGESRTFTVTVTVSSTAPTTNFLGSDSIPGDYSMPASKDLVNIVNVSAITADKILGNNTYYQPTNVSSNPALTLAKVATPTTYSAAGEVITYNYTLTNSGDVTLTGPFTVTDDKAFPVEIGGPAATLTPGASLSFTASYTILQSDIEFGSVKNIAQGHGLYLGAAVHSNYDDETVTAVKNPALELTKSGAWVDGDADGFADVGELINYTFSVKNIGNVTLTNITVTDPKVTVVGGPLASLAVGATDSTTFTGSYAITQADIDAGKVDNTATADSNESGPDTDDETVMLPQNPAIDIEKYVSIDGGANWVDADEATGPLTVFGSEVMFKFIATNIGNVTLTNIILSDTDFDLSAATIPSTLSVGHSFEVKITTNAIEGQHSNTATVYGDFVDANASTTTVQDSDLAHYLAVVANQPSIQINTLTAAVVNTTPPRTTLTGTFNITDESNSGRKPDGFMIYLTEYQVDWEYALTGAFQGFDFTDNWFMIGEDKVYYDVTYAVVNKDGVKTVVPLSPNETIIFDESVTISYMCTFYSDDAHSTPYTLPSKGTLRGTASASIFNRTERVFTFSSTFTLGGRKGL